MVMESAIFTWHLDQIVNLNAACEYYCVGCKTTSAICVAFSLTVK